MEEEFFDQVFSDEHSFDFDSASIENAQKNAQKLLFLVPTTDEQSLCYAKCLHTRKHCMQQHTLSVYGKSGLKVGKSLVQNIPIVHRFAKSGKN